MIRQWLTKICVALTVATSVISYNAVSASQVFTQATFEQLKQQNLGKQWLLMLWSVDCPPCFKELALIEKLYQQSPNIAIAIVNTDDGDSTAQDRKNIMASYQLDELATFHFSNGQGDRNRYMIDKNWYGELPRSYFVEAGGKFHGISGLVKENLLRKWLVTEEK